MLKVTCAIIELNKKVLAVQRSECMTMPLKWEFPGGKLENNESEEECIIREIREELNIEIELVARLTPSQIDDLDLSIFLIPFVAHHANGYIKLLEHKQYRWLNKDELKALDWADADKPILNEYLAL